MEVRAVRAGEAKRLRTLRLAALTADPDAFGSTLAREKARPTAAWGVWAAASEAGGEQRTFVVADAADRWLGMALVRRDDERGDHAVLNSLWVAPEARGQGAARALCDACAEWAVQRGLRSLGVSVVVGNERALRACVAAGFVISGQRTDVQPGRTLEELVLVRDLVDPA